MDAWDSEPAKERRIEGLINVKSKWEGEDADEDVMDCWDQDDFGQEKMEEVAAEADAKKEISNGKGDVKKLVEKFERKERKESVNESVIPHAKMTPEKKLAEKLRVQKLQQESDLLLAKEVFGVLGKSAIESKEDFDTLKDEVLKLTSVSVKNSNFVAFTEEIIHSLAVHLSSVDVKRLHNWLGNLHIEKSKIEKGDKIKKPKTKGKAKLKMDGEKEYVSYLAYDQDYSDYM